MPVVGEEYLDKYQLVHIMDEVLLLLVVDLVGVKDHRDNLIPQVLAVVLAQEHQSFRAVLVQI